MKNIHLHSVITNFHKPIAIGFLKSVSAFSGNNALWINNCFYSYEQLAQIVLSIYQKIPTDKTYERIGIYCNDDVYTYASILAVNLYGAAYVPLNNTFPIARNKNILKQCELGLILSSVENEDLKLLANKTCIISTCHFDQRERSHTIQEELSRCTTNDRIKNSTAYILFTSGTTDEPKGVPVSHTNLNNFFDFFLKNYDFNQNDKFLQVYELTFDVSAFSFFMPLLVGACCYVVPNDDIKFIKILQMMQEHKITIVSMVPSVLHYVEKYLAEVKLESLRYSFFSGDSLNHNLAVKWSKTLRNAHIHNFYGPTETTIVCTHYLWNESQSAIESVNGIVPLGKPFEGMDVLIVDSTNQPAEKGELCFSGTQVMQGYLYATNEDNFFNYQNKRYYKTGDIASYNENGNLIFYGRTDSQVKINGYRVELGEIAFVIEKIINAKCTVLCSKDKKQINKLVAFVETNDLNEEDLKQSLSLLLPDYMLPKQFIAIEKFPLNVNGKVDKNKLLNLQE